ncbi:hypothetical protein CNMCM5623_009856 [Aspergillus felis]|uniref:Uncharacterized protein n=1 Tax=Aspergillus felis TaxID=1287682 RepID=A0A8H6UT02_9EURO|nr:hypothetical protein CNMCM5623_009856 [Aspergillus felis]
MRTSVVPPQIFLSPSAIKLGRLVTSVDEPHQNYYDPSPEKDFGVIVKVEDCYDYADTLGRHRSFMSDLTAFLSSTVSSRTKTSIRITADQVKTYYLDNNGQWFREVVRLVEVRKWITRTIDEGEDIYIVVGYHTASDAHVIEKSMQQKTVDGKVAMPISDILGASGVVVPYADLTDPGLAGSSGRAEERYRQFVARGEQIIAVQYRKIRFKFLSSKNVDNALLGNEIRWERYDRPRYHQSQGEDLVEITLEDDLALEGAREECITGNDVFIASLGMGQ